LLLRSGRVLLDTVTRKLSVSFVRFRAASSMTQHDAVPENRYEQLHQQMQAPELPPPPSILPPSTLFIREQICLTSLWTHVE
jgi:hypothetical protein